MARRKKGPREKDLTSRFLSGNLDEDRVDPQQRFSQRSKHAVRNKMLKTAALRAGEELAAEAAGDVEALPVGQVVQVYSLYAEVEHDGRTWLCAVRRTLTKVAGTYVVVGDRVRFRDVTAKLADGTPAPAAAAAGDAPPEGVIEQILPRQTVLTRAESFKGTGAHPIVANAGQMLIVASLWQPVVKWGLVDRMLVAAQGGGLRPILCLNKVDLADADEGAAAELRFAREALAHYESLGVRTLQTSVPADVGLGELRDVLRDQTTVLAGHSGVGKSSLISSIQPQIDIRVGEVSEFTAKGRHTTTSARRYVLSFGGAVVDTPGVKVFGLWGVTRSNLPNYFPDVANDTAPDWRQASYERIEQSLPEEE